MKYSAVLMQVACAGNLFQQLCVFLQTLAYGTFFVYLLASCITVLRSNALSTEKLAGRRCLPFRARHTLTQTEASLIAPFHCVIVTMRLPVRLPLWTLLIFASALQGWY